MPGLRNRIGCWLWVTPRSAIRLLCLQLEEQIEERRDEEGDLERGYQRGLRVRVVSLFGGGGGGVRGGTCMWGMCMHRWLCCLAACPSLLAIACRRVPGCCCP